MTKHYQQKGKPPRAVYTLPENTKELQAVAIGRALLVTFNSYPQHIIGPSLLSVLTLQQCRELEQLIVPGFDVITNDLQAFRDVFISAFQKAYPKVSKAYTPEAHRIFQEQHTPESRIAAMLQFGKQSLDILADKASQAG